MKERRLYLDLLRILATMAVIMIHVSTLHYYNFDPRSIGWQTINFYDAISRWSVPVFTLISGALFLQPGRPLDVRKLYGRNILRLVTAFVFWSALYALFYAKSAGEFVLRLIRGNYHMWYVLMIIGLYIMIPVFRTIVEKPQIAQYCLLVSLPAVFIIPELLHIPALSVFEAPVKNLRMQLSLGYSAYFIGGWYLSRTAFSRKQRGWIYALGAAGLLVSIAATSCISYVSGKASPDPFFSYFSTEVMLESAALFVLVKTFAEKRHFGEKTVRIITTLSNYSFGAYLAHIMVLEVVQKAGLTVMVIPAVFSVPVICAVVYALSMLASALLHHIPVLKRYVV